jgi:hypothetical protein
METDIKPYRDNGSVKQCVPIWKAPSTRLAVSAATYDAG